MNNKGTRTKTLYAQVKGIAGLKAARVWLGLSQQRLADLCGVDQSQISKAERAPNSKHYRRLTDAQAERIAIEVSRQFRALSGRDDLGLRFQYNSPLRFTIGGYCRWHKCEFEVRRMTDRCPKCRGRDD